MKHIPAEHDSHRDCVVFKCVSCGQLLINISDLPGSVFYTLNVQKQTFGVQIQTPTGPISCLDISDNHCWLTCAEALIKGIIE